MAADPQPQDAQSDDLFGRWLAHHEQRSPDQSDTTARSEAISGTTSETPPTSRSRRLPSAAIASSAVDRDPMIGSRLVPPSNFGSRRPAANAPARPGPVNELDREPPPGWEPIVMASIRKKSEKPVAKPDTRSRLQRLKARLVDPPEPSDDDTDEPEVPTVVATPVGPSVPPVTRPVGPSVTPPAATVAPTRQASSRSMEEAILAAAAIAEPQVARHAERPVEPSPERSVRTVVEPVVEPAVEQPVQEQVVLPVELPLETEEVVARQVRAFIDATPVTAADPEAAAADAVTEPEASRVQEPVAQSVVELAEPEPVLTAPAPETAPEPEPELLAAPVVEPEVAPEPAPATPVVERLAPVEEPVVEEPVVEEPVVEEPVVEEPVVDEPAAEETPIETPEEQPVRFAFLKALREPREPREPAQVVRSSTGDAARDLVAAKARARAATTAAESTTATPVVVPEPVVVAPAPEPEPELADDHHSSSRHDEVATEMPGHYTFTPKRSVRRVLTFAMLIGMVITAYFVCGAYDTRDTPSMGLAAIAVLATAMLWAIRAGASVTKLAVHQGQLEVVQQGGRFVFDLASQYTMVQVHGQPGKRGWKVLFPRRGMAAFTVDASMVDPDDFMRVLRFFRPQLVHH